MGTPAEDRIYLLNKLARVEQQLATVRTLRQQLSGPHDHKRLKLAVELERLLAIDLDNVEYVLDRERKNGRGK